MYMTLGGSLAASSGNPCARTSASTWLARPMLITLASMVTDCAFRLRNCSSSARCSRHCLVLQFRIAIMPIPVLQASTITLLTARQLQEPRGVG